MSFNLSGLTSGDNYKVLRRKCPPFGSKREKWVKAYQLFCEDIESLAEKSKSGYRLESRAAHDLKERVKKISERTQVHSERKKLLDAHRRLEKNQESFDPFAVPPELNEIAIPQFKKGLLSTALQLLHFQGAMGWIPKAPTSQPIREAQVAPLQEKLAHFRDEMNESMEKTQGFTCPLKQPQSWKTSKRQSFPIQTLEKELRSAVQELRPSFSSMEKELRAYGNKHKNHVLMHRFLSLSNSGEVTVLPSFGLTSHEVHAFLKEHAAQIYVHWDALKSLYGAHTGDQPFFAREDVAQHLSAIEEEIDHAFDLAAENPDAVLPKEMQKWLEEMGQKQERLMVRSTGAEDSHKLANAGGNTSKNYVKPTPAALCTAASKVIQSYFGKTSLQNRINAGMNPFEEELLLAVTSEQLIGEPIGGAKNPEEIPISFVLFSNEPLYIGEEEFRVMRISATFGHGEGVVSGEQGIAADTALLIQSESRPDQIYVLYNTQEKAERLAPVESQDGQVSLEKVANPDPLISRPAIDQQMLGKLYRSGVLMEAFFGEHPTDIEGVIKNGKIYFVQARPINRKPLLPTYLDTQKTPAAHLSASQAEMLVPGRASVVTATKREEILFAQTLKDAERIYGFATSNGQNPYKLVIVAKPEPDNSHPVVNFSGLGIPCLYISNPLGVEALLAEIHETHPLAACTQTGKLILWDSDKAPLEEHIVEGFAVHPAKVAISLPVPEKLAPPLFDSAKDTAERELKDLLIRISDGEGLDELERHPLLAHLRRGTQALEEKFHSMRFSPVALETRLEALKELEKGIDRVIREIRAHDGSSTRLERLLHIKVLKTLLLGSETVHLGRYSLLDVEPLLAAAGEVCAYQETLNHRSPLIDLLLDGSEAGPEAFTWWKGFLKKLEPHIEKGTISKEDLGRFKEFISVLKQANALPTWLTFSRLQIAEGGIIHSITRYFGLRLPEEIEELRSMRMPSESTALMKEMIGEQQWVRQMEGQLDYFADPKTFPTAWARLKEHAEKTYASIEWLKKIKDASPIAKAAAATTLERAVNLFDLAAKTLKSSSQFESDGVKLSHFKEMLQFYLSMTKEWTFNLVDPRAIPTHARTTTHLDFFERINHEFEQMPDNNPAQFLPSLDFSVSAAMLGSNTAFERHLPRTCEDILTLDHQSKLTVVTALGRGLIGPEQIKKSNLPHDIKQVLLQVEGNSRIQRVGMKVDPKGVTIQYNVPLQNHSGRIDLFYNFHKKTFTFTGKLLGQARVRWPAIKGWIESLERAGIIHINEQISQTEQELIYSATVPIEGLFQTTEHYLTFADYSSGFPAEEVAIQLVRGLETDDAAKLASECFLDPNQIVNDSGIHLLERMIREGRGVAQIIQWIRQPGSDRLQKRPSVLNTLIVHSDPSFEPDIRQLLDDLMQSDEEALISAYVSIQSDRFDPYILDLMTQKQSKGIPQFLVPRVGRGYLIKEAIEFAQNQMKKPLEEGTLRVIKALFSGGHWEKESAAEVANVGMRDPNLRENALEILNLLAMDGDESYIDLSAAALGIESKEPRGISITLSLFRGAFLTREGGFETALRLAEKGMRFRGQNSIQRDAYNLYGRLYALGKDRSSIADSISRLIREGEISEPLLEVVKNIKNELAPNDINRAAIIGVQNQNPNKALEIISSQVMRGAFDSQSALDLAISACERGHCYPPLFEELIEKGIGVDRILKLAIDFSEKQFYIDSMRLFLLLVQKDVGVQEAISTVEKDYFKHERHWSDYAHLFEDYPVKSQHHESLIRLGIEQVKQNRQKDHYIVEDLIEWGSGLDEMMAAIESDFFDESSLTLFSLIGKHSTLMDSSFLDPSMKPYRAVILNRWLKNEDPKIVVRILEFFDTTKLLPSFFREVCRLASHANEDVRRKAVLSLATQIKNDSDSIGYYYDVIQVAKNAIQDESIREQGFELLHELMIKGRGRPLALEAVQSGLKDPKMRVRKIAADIETLL